MATTKKVVAEETAPVQVEGEVKEAPKPWYRRVWENPTFQKWSKRAAIALGWAGTGVAAYFAGKGMATAEPVVVYRDLPQEEITIDEPTEETEGA